MNKAQSIYLNGRVEKGIDTTITNEPVFNIKNSKLKNGLLYPPVINKADFFTTKGDELTLSGKHYIKVNKLRDKGVLCSDDYSKIEIRNNKYYYTNYELNESVEIEGFAQCNNSYFTKKNNQIINSFNNIVVELPEQCSTSLLNGVYKIGTNKYFLTSDNSDCTKNFIAYVDYDNMFTRMFSIGGPACLDETTGLITGQPTKCIVSLEILFCGKYYRDYVRFPSLYECGYIINDDKVNIIKTEVDDRIVIKQDYVFEPYECYIRNNNTVDFDLKFADESSVYNENQKLLTENGSLTKPEGEYAPGYRFYDISTWSFEYTSWFDLNDLFSMTYTIFYINGEINGIKYAQSTVINPNDDFGSLWSKSSLQDNVHLFPNCGFTINKQSDKGVIYDYGKGWCKWFSQKRTVYTTNKTTELLTQETVLCQMEDGIETAIPLNPKGKSNISKTIGSYWPTTSLINKGELSDEQEWSGFEQEGASRNPFVGRRHLITKQVINNKKWYKIIDFIAADLSAFSWKRLIKKVNNNSFYIHYYKGLPIAASVNDCLLTTTSEEILTFAPIDEGIIVDGVEYTISDNVSDLKVFKISDYLFYTNIYDGNNGFIYNENKKQLQKSFIAYNNEVELLPDVINKYALYYARDGQEYNNIVSYGSGYNVQMIATNENNVSSSFLLPAQQIYCYINESDIDYFSTAINDLRNIFINPINNNTEIDFYYSHLLDSTDITYKYTKTGKVVSFKTSDSDFSYWIDANTAIYPIGENVQIEGYNTIQPTVILEDDYSSRLYFRDNILFLSFNQANRVYKGSTVFTLYTSNYYFDGQSIYYIGSDQNNQVNQFVCYANGLMFLANSGTEAYFYSSVEKCIYTFTGSNTLQREDDFSSLSNVKSAAFLSVDQTLYLLFDEGLYCKYQDNDNKSSSWFIPLANVYNRLETSNRGIIVCSETDDDCLIYISTDEISSVPLIIETKYMGDYQTLFNTNYYDILFYQDKLFSARNKQVEITVSVLSNENNENKITKTITKQDFGNNDHYRFRLTPNTITGSAFKIKIVSYLPIANLAVCSTETGIPNGDK